MNIKKFIAENTQEAMNMVKKEMGPDAVILGTKTISRQGRSYGRGKKAIEVTAAVDYDASVETSTGRTEGHSSIDRLEKDIREIKDAIYSADAGSFLNPDYFFNRDLKERYSNYKTFGLNADIIMDLMNEEGGGLVHADTPKTDLLRESLVKVLSRIRIDQDEKNGGKRRIYSFVGPTGVGKTTTLAKLAAMNAIQSGRKTALITLDTYRIAAMAQLQTYARIMDLPLEVAVNGKELKEAISKHQDCDRIFIDTAGRSPNKNGDIAELKKFFNIDEDIHPFLVLSAGTQYQNMVKAEKRFGELSFRSIIFTKLDESEDQSDMINFLLTRQKPVSYFTAGQNVPEDIESASRKKLATFLLAGMRGTQNNSISEESNDRSSCRS